jgi:hypothetical protein
LARKEMIEILGSATPHLQEVVVVACYVVALRDLLDLFDRAKKGGALAVAG